MVGSSFRAAEAVGVRTWRTVTGAYLWAGLFPRLPGIMLASATAGNMDYGVGYDYDAIAAVLVGGTAIGGGQGSILRTMAGVLVIAVARVILLLNGLRQEWQYLISGVIILSVILLQTTVAGSSRAMPLMHLLSPYRRPAAVFVAVFVLLLILDGGRGGLLGRSLLFSRSRCLAPSAQSRLGSG